MPTLYDQYRLSNSTVVPMFTGTAAPEALQVGQHMQQLYDIAKTGAADVNAATDNLASMEVDIPLQNEVRTKIQGDVERMAKAKNWEDFVDPVRALGRYYASRSMELAAPLKQYQEYQKSLDDKELGLTPAQKQVLLARSKAGYQGLKKDGFGRFQGSFSGVGAAKNMDMSAYVDKVMANMEEFKNADSVAYSDGKGYIVTRKGSVTYVDPKRVESALQSALGMDSNVQAYLQMEGDNAGFLAGSRPISQVPDTVGGQPNVLKQQAIQQAAKTGYPAEQIYAQLTRTNRIDGIAQEARNYAVTKYAFKREESERGLSGDSTWQHNDKKETELGIFGDVVPGTGIDLTAQFGSPGDISTSRGTATTALETAQQEVQVSKETIARKLGVKAGDLTDKQITDYYTAENPTGFGKYKAAVQAIESNKSRIATIDQLQTEAMDIATRQKFPDKTYKSLQQDATSKFQKSVKEGNLTIDRGGIKIDSSNVDKYDVVDGDSSSGTGVGYVVLRDKSTGKEFKVSAGATGLGESLKGAAGNKQKMATDKAVEDIGASFNGISWQNTWKEAATNLRSNSMWMPLQNKTTPDGHVTKAGAYASRVAGILRAGTGGLSVKDGDLNEISSDKRKDIEARINSGKFDVLGVGKVGSDGKMYVQLSIEKDASADDPADRYQKVVVGVSTNMTQKLAKAAIDAGVRDQDQRAIQLGYGMMPGSGYEKVLNMSTTGRLQISDNKSPLYEIVPNITGQSSDAITYEVYKLNNKGERISSEATFDDAFDLGRFIDENQYNGRKVTTKTK